MEITITKGRTEDRIEIVHPGGRRMETTFAKKGPVPHDAIHWFVERELGLTRAFWGMVGRGHHPEEIAEIAKAAGHASAARAAEPDPAIVELLQAERLVECFEADLWSGGSGAVDDLLALAEVACNSSYVPLPVIDARQVTDIRAAIAHFARDWIAAPQGYSARLVWE